MLDAVVQRLTKTAVQWLLRAAVAPSSYALGKVCTTPRFATQVWCVVQTAAAQIMRSNLHTSRGGQPSPPPCAGPPACSGRSTGTRQCPGSLLSNVGTSRCRRHGHTACCADCIRQSASKRGHVHAAPDWTDMSPRPMYDHLSGASWYAGYRSSPHGPSPRQISMTVDPARQ